jgi:nitrate reductase cytochrome c-type subunit
MAVYPPARILPARAALLLWLAAAAAACGSGSAPIDLEDPAACKTCHPTQYAEWSGSMHAYASEDPVFRAMNKRAQRENPATGTFCLQCHAPVAVRDKLTQDGSNLDTLVPAKRGVTCFFCHAAESVTGTHNNPLVLATDNSLYGPFGDPAPNTPHKAIYSRMFDDTAIESVNTCGSCHDIQNLQGAHVERTFEEWQPTLFAVSPNGQTCVQCHMPTYGRVGPASNVSTVPRTLHSHTFPAVDLPVTPFPADNPQNDAQRAESQAVLDQTVQGTLCVNQVSQRIEVTLDNVGAGHNFPSGATPDRRAWIEVTAWLAGNVIYSSGGSAARPLEDSADPDLWLLRDCIYDAAGQETKLFWQAATVTTPYAQLLGSPVLNVNDPSSYSRNHHKKLYPDPGPSGTAPAPGLAQLPDHVTVAIHLQAIGDDVLDDLVASGDLDAAIPPAIARYDLGGGGVLDWTPTDPMLQQIVDPMTSVTRSCIVTSLNYPAMTTTAVSHAHCSP